MRYAALALMMPYAPFQAAAERSAYDVDVLRGRFQVSFEQVANRLTTLQRQGAPGIPFFMLEVDNAGNRFRRSGARGFPVQRFGGGCPKLGLHAAFAQPGQILVETVEMPDGAEFLTIARTLEGLAAGFEERPGAPPSSSAATSLLQGHGLRPVFGRTACADQGRPRLPPLRTAGLPCPRRAAADPSART